MADDEITKEEILEVLWRAIQVCEFLKDGYHEQKVPFRGKGRTAGEIGDLCVAVAFPDKLPAQVYERLHRLAWRVFPSHEYHQLRDGADTLASGGALLRKVYDRLPKP